MAFCKMLRANRPARSHGLEQHHQHYRLGALSHPGIINIISIIISIIAHGFCVRGSSPSSLLHRHQHHHHHHRHPEQLIFFSVRTFLGSGAGGPAGWCLTHIQTRPRGSLGAAICETVCETVAICASMPLCPDHRPGACPSAPVPPSPSVRSPLGPRRYLSFFRPFWPSWQRSARRQKST